MRFRAHLNKGSIKKICLIFDFSLLNSYLYIPLRLLIFPFPSLLHSKYANNFSEYIYSINPLDQININLYNILILFNLEPYLSGTENTREISSAIPLASF